MTMTASPIPKNGNCPTGWNTQGNYCVKKSNVE